MHNVSILENMVTSIIIVDQQLNICYNNPAAEQLLKLSTKRMVGSHLTSVYHHLSSSKQLFEQSFKTEQGFTDNLATLICLDLRSVTVDLCVSPLLQEQPFLLLEIRQVDQQQRISAEMQQMTQQQLAKDLVKGLAHEIKNPLGGLRGAAQLLHRQLSDDSKEYTQMIMEQADRLNNLVERLLGPNKHHQHSKHNIHQVLEKIVQLVSFELPAGIHIERDYDPSIPDISIDPEQIQQALLNIIQNAIQALAKQGEIKIITRVANQLTINGKRHRLAIEIKILDNGPGIPDELRQTLFYPMVTGRAEGTGLGLSIAQTLIQQHQGRVDFISRPGYTEFNVTIPVNHEKEM
ncbi:nitrogen regulation protein NR(II) [Psychrobium sp. 1_MG-2023]|uniref:nitrogen regulation protein NR(II) n=1 Tax=Psychrobium sp. 1_MG-2023 TaxID=3062624 RepID=UPI0027329E1E|nr:nitrogen regulation protein NR(II) [Psychrobium sp. 1_MG-2023]MDP2561042.1 nitrogen regulation protein NR(II) [Psychrobium sp. 1_MG-2023]